MANRDPRPLIHRSPSVITLAGVLLLVWTHGGDSRFAGAQQPGAVTGGAQTMYRVGGGHRDGPSAFPKVEYGQLKPVTDGELDFQPDHTFEESTALLRMWAERYPEIVELYSVGHSLEGRDIWQITITNKKTGPHTDKPAFFMEGGRHAGEISGIEATLYFINEVLSGYGTDPALTRLVDTKTIYARPNQNPDGSSRYHYTAQTLRSNVRPVDNDNDGRFDEDPGEDLDGDGCLRQMRQHVGAGQGTFVIDERDPKGRAMRRVGPHKGDYEVYSEGIDNDGDGRYNEDGVGHGPDFGYFSFGSIWYGNEIWNGGRFEDYDKDGRFEEWELYRWHDEHRAGKDDDTPWTKFQHPQLGEVEIGGFNPKFYLQNSPPDLLEEWAGNEARFNLYLAQQLPQVRIVSADVKGAGDGAFVIEMTVTNEGGIPTALEQATRVKIVRPDTARITLGDGMELVKADETPGPPTADIELDWLNPGEQKTARWRVKGKGTIEVAILSTRGGVDRRTGLALQ